MATKSKTKTTKDPSKENLPEGVNSEIGLKTLDDYETTAEERVDSFKIEEFKYEEPVYIDELDNQPLTSPTEGAPPRGTPKIVETDFLPWDIIARTVKLKSHLIAYALYRLRKKHIINLQNTEVECLLTIYPEDKSNEKIKEMMKIIINAINRRPPIITEEYYKSIPKRLKACIEYDDDDGAVTFEQWKSLDEFVDALSLYVHILYTQGVIKLAVPNGETEPMEIVKLLSNVSAHNKMQYLLMMIPMIFAQFPELRRYNKEEWKTLPQEFQNLLHTFKVIEYENVAPK